MFHVKSLLIEKYFREGIFRPFVMFEKLCFKKQINGSNYKSSFVVQMPRLEKRKVRVTDD